MRGFDEDTTMRMMTTTLIVLAVASLLLARPHEIECPNGSYAEGEPICQTGYVDTYNNGCDSHNPNPPNFSTIECGDRVCGTSGFYQSPFGYQSDTDWYEVVIAERRAITLSVSAEFNANVQMFSAGAKRECNSMLTLASGRCKAGDELRMTAIFDPGIYWLALEPDGVAPRGARYAMSLTCEGVEGVALAASSPVTTPSEYVLHQNYPNPFNPSTQITFGLGEAGSVLLRVFNLTGQQVATVANDYLSAGEHAVTFDGTGLPAGVYAYRLDVNGFSATKKMLLIK